MWIQFNTYNLITDTDLLIQLSVCSHIFFYLWYSILWERIEIWKFDEDFFEVSITMNVVFAMLDTKQWTWPVKIKIMKVRFNGWFDLTKAEHNWTIFASHHSWCPTLQKNLKWLQKIDELVCCKSNVFHHWVNRIF